VFSDGSYRNFAIDSVFVGVSDNRLEPGTAAKPVPTIIHGVLFLPRDMTGAGHDPNAGHLGSCPKPILLDISGRKVMDLRPGENDVRHLAPGVYFVRDEGRGTKDAGRTRKVVITR
jgi:hypothetical protein